MNNESPVWLKLNAPTWWPPPFEAFNIIAEIVLSCPREQLRG
jgi:hypothetical protein